MSAPVLPNTFIGDYRVVDFVGAGGMGEVYRAIHAREGRVVAIKLLTRAGCSQKVIDRFLNEASIQARLDHPYVAKFHELTSFNNQPCIIMEYIDGQTLAERIKSVGPLPLSEVVYIFQAVTEAIHYIHGHGIVHRDIKANNIRISSTGQIKLLDFGISKSESTPKLTATGDTIGTLEYLSPEQLKGGITDFRSDIWALGVLLYEMVTAHVPFEANTIGDLCDKIMKVDYVRPTVLNPAILPELEAIIARCLKRKAAERYQSARDLLNDTARAAAGISTPRLSSLGGLNLSWITRNRVPVSIAALVLVVVIGAFLIFGGGSPPENPGLNKSAGTKNRNLSQANAGGTPQSEFSQALSPSRDSQLRKIRINVIGGQGDVYDSEGGWKSKTPYEFSERIGQEVKLVLKRDGYVDHRVSFRVSEDNMYDFTMEKVEKDRR